MIDPASKTVSKITNTEMTLMIGMIAMIAGIIIAWFREGIGGLLIVAGFVFFVAVELITNKKFEVWFLLFFLAVGLLHLFCWRQSS